MKKTAAVLFALLLTCFAVFADYTIRILNSDSMTVNDQTIILDGNVSISFTTTGENVEKKEREMTADRIYVDLDNQYVQATGNVYLKEGKDATFQGEAVTFNWEDLDVVVFGGVSSSEKTGSSKKKVTFYLSGDRVAYDGDVNIVYFSDGVVATKEEDPNWSVSAKKIGLFESDLFFYRAWIKIGRVPILYLPFFFYPGETFSFNPAVGFKSDRGIFLNTTTEIYGKYPSISSGSTTTTEDDLESTAVSIFSLMSSDDSSDKVRDGWIYKEVTEDTELSELEQWARKNSNYLAVFVDVWEKGGIALGYETKNAFKDINLSFTSKGVVAYSKDGNYEDFRYGFDLSATYSKDKLKLSLSMPFASDPEVKSYYYSRNTVFGLDQLLGTEQKINSSGSKSSSYSWTLSTGSFSWSYEKLVKLDLSAVKANIDFKYDSSEKKFVMSSAVLPSFSVSASGTLFSWKSSATTVEKEGDWTNSLAKQFDIALSELPETDENIVVSTTDIGLTPIAAPTVNLTQTTTIEGASASLTYKTSGSFENSLTKDYKPSSNTLKVSASTSFSGKVPGNWFTLSQSFSYSLKNEVSIKTDSKNNETKSQSNTQSLTSSLTATVPKLGLTYKLSNKVFNFTSKGDDTEKFEWAKWDKTGVTAHSISFSYTYKRFTFSISKNLEPLTGKVTPTLSYSYDAIKASVSATFDPEADDWIKIPNGTISFSYSKNSLNISVSAKYDLSKDDWKGFSVTQNSSFKLFNDKLSITENLVMKELFEPQTLSLSASYEKMSLSMNFKDKNFEPQNLRFSISHTQSPIYFWKNRIGFEFNLNSSFAYNFQNKYGSTLSFTMKFSLAVSEFLDFSLNVTSSNNSFYKYYDDNDKFSIVSLAKDLLYSFDFFGTGRYRTGFNMSNLSISAVHYMEDWNLYVTMSSSVKKKNNKYVWNPEFTAYIKWNTIPELKVENSYSTINGWEN